MHGAKLGLEMIESLVPAGMAKEASRLSIPLISLLSSASPSSALIQGDLLSLRTRLVLALSAGGATTRDALKVASMSFALEGETSLEYPS